MKAGDMCGKKVLSVILFSVTLLSISLEATNGVVQLDYSVKEANRSCAIEEELVTFTCVARDADLLRFRATQFQLNPITFISSDSISRVVERTVGASTFKGTLISVEGSVLTATLTVVVSNEVVGAVDCSDGLDTKEEELCVFQLAVVPGDRTVPFNSNVTFPCQVEGGKVMWEVDNIQLLTPEVRVQQEQNDIFVVDLPRMGISERSELLMRVKANDALNNTVVRCIGVDTALNARTSDPVKLTITVQQLKVVPKNQVVPYNFNNNVTFRCEVEGGVVVWEVNDIQLRTPEFRMQQEQKDIFVVDLQPEGIRERSELRVRVKANDALNNTMVRCISADVDTASYTNVSDHVRIIIFDAPETPRNLQVTLMREDSLVLSWDPPSNLPPGVETTYNVTVVNPGNGTVYPGFPMNRVNMTFVELIISCQLYEFMVTAENDAGSSDPAVINITTPLSPDVTSIIDSLMATVSFSGNDVLISLSFNHAVTCSDTFGVESYNIILNGENVMEFPDQGSDPIIVTLRSNEISALQPNVKYNITITACSLLACRQAEPITAVTTDVQSASVTFVETDVLLSFELAEGSSARGCVFIFSLNNETERFNVSRSDTMGVQWKRQMDTLAAECQTTLNLPDAYDNVEVVDWESDGSEGTLPMTVVPQEDPDPDNFVCSPPPPRTAESGSDVGAIVGGTLAGGAVLTAIVIAVSVTVYLVCRKSIANTCNGPPPSNEPQRITSDSASQEQELEIREKDKKIAQLEQQNSTNERTLASLQADLQAREVLLREKEGEARKREAEMSSLIIELRSLQQQNSTNERTLASLQADLQAREVLLREKEGEARKREAEMSSLIIELRSLQNEVAILRLSKVSKV